MLSPARSRRSSKWIASPLKATPIICRDVVGKLLAENLVDKSARYLFVEEPRNPLLGLVDSGKLEAADGSHLNQEPTYGGVVEYFFVQQEAFAQLSLEYLDRRTSVSCIRSRPSSSAITAPSC